MEEVLKSVRETVRRFHMFTRGDLVLVGVSGGPDSLALLHVLCSLREELDIGLHVAHLNHRLRPEAGDDAAFVASVAAGLGLPFTVAEADVAGLARRRRISLEEAGREARYEFFGRLREETGARRLALGHNRDDLAETVLMRVLRGTGPWGLAGIPPVRDGWIVRPLLDVPRAAVEAYCRAAGLEPRRDVTNVDPAAFRNRVRHRILPYLAREANPRVAESLARLADVVREDEEWLAGLVAERFAALARKEDGAITFPLDEFASLPRGLQRRLLRQAFAALGGGTAGPDFAGVERALGLLERSPGRRVALGPGVDVWREQATVAVARRLPRRPFCYRLPVPGSVEVPEAGVLVEALVLSGKPGAEPSPDSRWEARAGRGARQVLLDAGAVTGPLAVRSRREGDRLWLQGLPGPARLKGLLRKWGVPRRLRDRIALVTACLATGDEVILWVVGHAVDARFARVGGAERLLLLRCVELPAAIC